jgi:hypothetical protein
MLALAASLTVSSVQVFDLLDVHSIGVLSKSELSNLADALFAVGVTYYLVGRTGDNKVGHRVAGTAEAAAEPIHYSCISC